MASDSDRDGWLSCAAKEIQSWACLDGDGLDEVLRSAIRWVDEGDVRGIAARRVDREDDQRAFDDFGNGVHRVAAEKQELAGT